MNGLVRCCKALLTTLGCLAFVAACGGGGDGAGGVDRAAGGDRAGGAPPLSAAVTAVVVTPIDATVPIGATRQFTATASFIDGTSRDVTTLSAWTSDNTAAAGVGSDSGLATGASAGTAVIRAAFGGMSTSANLTVTSATLLSIALTPAAPTLPSGSTRQLNATGTYSDGSRAALTTVVTWSSSDSLVATILSSGIATGQSVGVATASATLGSISSSTTLTVTAAAPASTLALGTATSFGLLAGTSITNNAGGTTLVTGDIGSPSQTVDPVQAAGYTNYKSGAILSGALADLQAAVADANGRTCDVNFAGGADLGGQTFGPGVYCFGGAVTITGTLTLNGSGLYLFRTAMTLGTAANSIVALTNGATAGNLFFVPSGPAVVGVNSVFKGTLLTGSASITIGDNTTLVSGRALSGGAVTLRNNQISTP